MDLISYRGAAKQAGCSIASIQRAVRSGALNVQHRGNDRGFDPREVQEWSNQRVTFRMLINSGFSLQTEWTDAFTRMAVDILQSGEQDFDVQVKILKNRVFEFVEYYMKYGQYREIYIDFSETVYGQISDNLEFQDHDANDDKLKLSFLMYNFIKSQLFYLMPTLSKLGLLKEDGETPQWQPYDELATDSFSSFLDELKRRGIYSEQSGR